MIIKEHFVWAVRSIVSNKLRSSLSMLWIIIWISAIIILLALGNGTSSKMMDKFSSMWANLLSISPWSSNSTKIWWWGWSSSTDLIDDDFVEFVESIDWVKTVSPTVTTSRQFIYSTYNTSSSIVWVTSVYKDLKNLTVSNWNFITDKDNTQVKEVAVIWYTLAQNAFGTEDPVWKEIKLKNNIYTVVWVLASNSSSNNKVYVPLNTAMSKLLWTHYYSSLDVAVKDTDKVDYMKSLLQTELLKYLKIDSVDDATFSISSMSEMLESMEEMSATMTLFLGWIASISLIVWWIWVMNIMLVSVTERTKEIGIRKALGATRNDILLQFLIESMLISIFAGAIWISISFLAVNIINNYTTAIITYNSVLLSCGSVVMIWVVFWILPASKASNLEPIDALRYE